MCLSDPGIDRPGSYAGAPASSGVSVPTFLCLVSAHPDVTAAVGVQVGGFVADAR